MEMARSLVLLYLGVILGPLAVAAAVFALRDRVSRRPSTSRRGDGQSGAEDLTQTVEEVRP